MGILGMQRPAWTICFGVVWLLLFIAAIIMHVALGTVVPAIEDFPENLVKGFMVAFGFEQLQALSGKVETEAMSALRLCDDFVPSTSTCAGVTADPSTYLGTTLCQKQVDTTAHRDKIVTAFQDGLRKIETVGNDKYFGTPELATASGSIGEMETEMNKITGSQQCCAVAPVYCKIWESAETLDQSYTQIKAEIDKLTTGGPIDTFNDYAQYLKFLHILPWILVLSTVFFAFMWWKNGACCCCSNGSVAHFCLLALPQAIFWLLAFIFMSIFTVIGFAFGPVVMEVKVDSFKGQPTVGVLIEHIQNAFPEFWKIVFDDLESGLATFRTASTLFVIASIIIIVYSCCFCCCRPYGKGENADKASGEV